MPALSTAKPSVHIKFDQPRPIRYDWNAGFRFEEAYGKSIPMAMSSDQIGVRLITYLAWAGMLHREPSLSIDAVKPRIQGFLNSEGDITELATALLKALAESGVLGKAKRPALDEEEEPEPEAGNESAVPQG